MMSVARTELRSSRGNDKFPGSPILFGFRREDIFTGSLEQPSGAAAYGSSSATEPPCWMTASLYSKVNVGLAAGTGRLTLDLGDFDDVVRVAKHILAFEIASSI